MSPPAASTYPAIDTYWTDEHIILSLFSIQRGAHLPDNVIADINLYLIYPWNLPDGVWYFVKSQNNEETDAGFWKPKGDACHIYSGPLITGWKTTLEYFEGKSPNASKTDWVMQEYTITKNVSNSLEGNGKLCRVFCCHGESEDQRMLDSQNVEYFRAEDGSTAADDKTSNPGQGLQSRSQATVGLNEVSSLVSSERNLDTDCIGTGDFLELNDLLHPPSSSSSSVNSSRQSISSEERFDFLELNDLGPELISQEDKPKSTGYKYAIPASSARSEVVVLPPATGGSMTNSSRCILPMESAKAENSIPRHPKEKHPDEGGSKHTGQHRIPKKARKDSSPRPSSQINASSSSKNSVPMEQIKGAVSKKKGTKKYFNCFMPF